MSDLDKRMAYRVIFKYDLAGVDMLELREMEDGYIVLWPIGLRLPPEQMGMLLADAHNSFSAWHNQKLAAFPLMNWGLEGGERGR